MKCVSPVIAVLVTVLLAGCSVIKIKPEAEPVKLSFEKEELRGCTRIGEVVGSSGHWFDSWIINNDVLTGSALNDLRNKSFAMGGDAVFVPCYPLFFSTSVTILGQAYRCKR